ncbi:hypothetical protein [Agreia sp. COWG]|uniref:hypothetical protein n=1 Tax=Agreia sp. COWG TaxID=2773266 RepID=UPI001926FC2A|nr:hypothetical protein [Agreia sp. COWG]CAD5989644.1 conserved exported protein of unknown function [Agreia sp. COWG]
MSPTSQIASSRRVAIATRVALACGLTAAAIVVPTQAQAAPASTTQAVVLSAPASVPFTIKTYGGPDKKSFNGIRFAGTATPGSLVVVYYDAPGTPSGALKGYHIANTDGGDVSASGNFSFTATFPDLPAGATTLRYHARLVDPGEFTVIGRLNGVRSLTAGEQ